MLINIRKFEKLEIIKHMKKERAIYNMNELSHLDELEAEAMYIIREVAAECENPVMLYSIGKDSSVMLHLAMKAFYPEKPPFPFLHVNTGWKFKEMINFRDKRAKELGIEMIEYINPEGVEKNINPFDHGSSFTDIMKTQALKQALNKYGFTAAFGGGRRDEEKSRAKERIFFFIHFILLSNLIAQQFVELHPKKILLIEIFKILHSSSASLICIVDGFVSQDDIVERCTPILFASSSWVNPAFTRAALTVILPIFYQPSFLCD